MNKTFLTPITILFGILGSMALMAGSTLFDPLIRFIHTGVITPVQAGSCLLFTAAGFAACYFLLNMLCSYFVPRIASAENDAERMPSQTGGGRIRNKE
jgi:hypothetical protein